MKKKSGKKTLELSFYRKNLFIQIRRSNVKSHCEASYSQKSFNKSPLIVEERLILRMRQDDPTLAKFVRQILLFKNLKGAESMGPF
ncbi:unnamed protein product [Rhizophagus irregularis]|nr:unnamed protein product [Rhizophagus irregularis]